MEWLPCIFMLVVVMLDDATCFNYFARRGFHPFQATAKPKYAASRWIPSSISANQYPPSPSITQNMPDSLNGTNDSVNSENGPGSLDLLDTQPKETTDPSITASKASSDLFNGFKRIKDKILSSSKTVDTGNVEGAGNDDRRLENAGKSSGGSNGSNGKANDTSRYIGGMGGPPTYRPPHYLVEWGTNNYQLVNPGTDIYGRPNNMEGIGRMEDMHGFMGNMGGMGQGFRENNDKMQGNIGDDVNDNFLGDPEGNPNGNPHINIVSNEGGPESMDNMMYDYNKLGDMDSGDGNTGGGMVKMGYGFRGNNDEKQGNMDDYSTGDDREYMDSDEGGSKEFSSAPEPLYGSRGLFSDLLGVKSGFRPTRNEVTKPSHSKKSKAPGSKNKLVGAFRAFFAKRRLNSKDSESDDPSSENSMNSSVVPKHRSHESRQPNPHVQVSSRNPETPYVQYYAPRYVYAYQQAADEDTRYY